MIFRESILSPTPRNFRCYGTIIHYPNISSKGRSRNLWRIVHVENQPVGWRVAYLVLRDKTIGRLERHLVSDETFEPVCGRAVIFVSTTTNVQDLKCFFLDKPLIVRKGTWHGVITLDDEAHIKICENAQVACEYFPLGFRLVLAGKKKF